MQRVWGLNPQTRIEIQAILLLWIPEPNQITSMHENFKFQNDVTVMRNIATVAVLVVRAAARN